MSVVPGLIAAQEAQQQKHMIEQSMMTMAQNEMTHQTTLMNIASKGMDALQKTTADIFTSKVKTTHDIADNVTTKL